MCLYVYKWLGFIDKQKRQAQDLSKNSNRIIRDTFPVGMSCDEAFASKLTTPFVALTHSIHEIVVKQKLESTNSHQKKDTGTPKWCPCVFGGESEMKIELKNECELCLKLTQNHAFACISSKQSFVYHQFRRNCISSLRKGMQPKVDDIQLR